jgi:hypothetical protein
MSCLTGHALLGLGPPMDAVGGGLGLSFCSSIAAALYFYR